MADTYYSDDTDLKDDEFDLSFLDEEKTDEKKKEGEIEDEEKKDEKKSK